MATQITPAPFDTGKTLHEGDRLNRVLAAGPLQASQYNMVANGTTAATGTLMTAPLSHFGTVASGGYAVLPPAIAGTSQEIFNYGANTLNIAPYASTDVIDGGSAGAAVTLTTGHRLATFYCVSPGIWISDLGGAVSS